MRVLIKLSGEALAKDKTDKFDDNIIQNIARQIKYLSEKGNQICLVVGGGNFWRGRSTNNIDRVKSDQIGMLATIMNALYISDIFKMRRIKTKIMTPFLIGNITEVFSKDSAIEYLQNEFVLIFAGGLGHPFFSTDTITALRARELEADRILYAKNIDGIYTDDPKICLRAQKYKTVSYKELIQKEISAIDIAAISISDDITSIVFALDNTNSIIFAMEAEDNCKIGTMIKKDIAASMY